MKKLDSRTVRFTLKAPFVPFEDRVSYQLTAIVPIGYDAKAPVGTGPFKYKSFTPGQQSTFVAFENYRGPGPYVDELVIADYPQESARVNALISGQVDAVDAVPYSQIKVVEANSALQILISETGAWRPLTMLVDTPPYKDVRVRQALRFIADRQQMIDQALAGQGRIANDLYTPQDPLFDKSLPEREQDLEKAKSLLKQAGQSNLSIELVTAPVQGGIVAASLVYAEQAKAAGVNVKVNQLDPTAFYNSQYLNRPFSVDWWSSNSYFTQVAYADGPGASYNDTHWENPKYDALYKQAIAQPDQAKAAELAHEMQKMQYEEGGNINWGYANGVDAYSKKITGFVPDYSGQGLNSFNCKKVWFV
jgi:peptide/nickel transport system substrate-binding protein